ncbi:MAG: hypothetical protein QOF01_1622 [Thermomicrobiales bacterium]|nr:hypothetical protein [Thermomicrobiales bacterium]
MLAATVRPAPGAADARGRATPVGRAALGCSLAALLAAALFVRAANTRGGAGVGRAAAFARSARLATAAPLARRTVAAGCVGRFVLAAMGSLAAFLARSTVEPRIDVAAAVAVARAADTAAGARRHERADAAPAPLARSRRLDFLAAGGEESGGERAGQPLDQTTPRRRRGKRTRPPIEPLPVHALLLPFPGLRRQGGPRLSLRRSDRAPTSPEGPAWPPRRARSAPRSCS